MTLLLWVAGAYAVMIVAGIGFLVRAKEIPTMESDCSYLDRMDGVGPPLPPVVPYDDGRTRETE